MLQNLLSKIIKNKQVIEDFFNKKFSQNPALLYNSIDLRHSGFKIAPVDTNCFPAGFNNLSLTSKEIAKKLADDFLTKNFGDVQNILLIPENHTRNLRYLENVLALKNILNRNVEIGSLIADLQDKTTIDLENNQSITLNPLIRNNDKITTKDGFCADLIILNHDLTDGIPEILQNLTIPIIPSPNLGWHNRTKSNHFTIYNQLAEELAKIIEIDPWLISSMHKSCDDVDFKEQKGIECLAKSVDELLKKIKIKYQEYDIKEEPYCFIKADNGTYGMAVWPVFCVEDVLEINKKERNKMNMLKGSIKNTKVMIQEGIKTIDKIDGKISEAMIYLIDAKVTGNLFRINENRDEKISLNSDGMSFVDLINLNENQLNLSVNKDGIIEIYSLISRLAALAAAIESGANDGSRTRDPQNHNLVL
mgnify:CR=1 FL=1